MNPKNLPESEGMASLVNPASSKITGKENQSYIKMIGYKHRTHIFTPQQHDNLSYLPCRDSAGPLATGDRLMTSSVQSELMAESANLSLWLDVMSTSTKTE